MIFVVSSSLRVSSMSRRRVMRVGSYFEHSSRIRLIVMRVWHVLQIGGGVFKNECGNAMATAELRVTVV